jgi:hypothetical protein
MAMCVMAMVALAPKTLIAERLVLVVKVPRLKSKSALGYIRAPANGGLSSERCDT